MLLLAPVAALLILWAMSLASTAYWAQGKLKWTLLVVAFVLVLIGVCLVAA